MPLKFKILYCFFLLKKKHLLKVTLYAKEFIEVDLKI